MTPGATRNSRDSSRLEPTSTGTSADTPSAKASSGCAVTTVPSTTGANGSRLSARPPHLTGSGAVCTSTTRSEAAATRVSSSTAAISSRVGPVPRASARVRVTVRPTSWVRVCAAAPDWVIAWANSPLADGIDRSVVTLMAPADSPATVTRAGSPPKAEMFCCTHVRAATWSWRPRFAVPAATSASVNRNPSAASR